MVKPNNKNIEEWLVYADYCFDNNLHKQERKARKYAKTLAKNSLRKIKELNNFLLITVPASETYQCLFVEIPKIKQFQMVTCEKNGKWETTFKGHRTIKEKLPSRWTVPIKIEELTLIDVIKFCPDVCNVNFSLNWIEDMKLRNSYKFENWKRIYGRSHKIY